MNKKWTFILTLASGLLTAAAQESPDRLFRQGAGDFLPLYSGTVEPGYFKGYRNNPYYPKEYTPGSVTYLGWEYRDAEMLIDTYRQRLIVLSNDRKRRVEVPREGIQRLEIGGTEYVWKDKDDRAPLAAYYAVVYEGKESIYRLRHAGEPVRLIEDRQVLSKFVEREKLYLLRDGKWHELGGRSSYLKLHKDRKKELQRYCREQRLQPESDGEWRQLASYYENLIK